MALVMGLADLAAVSDVRGPLTVSMVLDTGKEIVQLPSNASSAPAPITQESACNSTEEHQHLLYNSRSTQRASIVELPPDNSWVSHETGNMNWGWGLQGGDDQGTVQNNAVSISGASETSDTHRSTGGGIEW